MVEHKNGICMVFHKRTIYSEESEDMVFSGYFKNTKDPERWRDRDGSLRREKILSVKNKLHAIQ